MIIPPTPETWAAALSEPDQDAGELLRGWGYVEIAPGTWMRPGDWEPESGP